MEDTLVLSLGTFLMETMACTAGHRAFQSPGISTHSPPKAKELGKVDKQTPRPGTISSPKTDLQVGGRGGGLERRGDNFTTQLRDMLLLPPPGSCPSPLTSFIASTDSHLLEDTVQCFWPANVKADEHGIRVWIGQRPDIVIVRGTW